MAEDPKFGKNFHSHAYIFKKMSNAKWNKLRFLPEHIIIKLLKAKVILNSLKSMWGEQCVTYKGNNLYDRRVCIVSHGCHKVFHNGLGSGMVAPGEHVQGVGFASGQKSFWLFFHFFDLRPLLSSLTSFCPLNLCFGLYVTIILLNYCSFVVWSQMVWYLWFCSSGYCLDYLRSFVSYKF